MISILVMLPGHLIIWSLVSDSGLPQRGDRGQEPAGGAQGHVLRRAAQAGHRRHPRRSQGELPVGTFVASCDLATKVGSL